MVFLCGMAPRGPWGGGGGIEGIGEQYKTDPTKPICRHFGDQLVIS